MAHGLRRFAPSFPDPQAQWAGIERRLAFRAKVRRGVRAGVLGGLVAMAASVALHVWPGPQEVPSARSLGPLAAELRWERGDIAWPFAAVASAEPSVFRLDDGSTVTAGPGTRVEMCRSGRSGCVEIRRGEAHVEAHHRLIVRVGRVQLETGGDAQPMHRFVVRYGQAGAAHGDVTVEVIQGRVHARIRDGKKTMRRTLQPGEVWRAGAAADRRSPSQADGAFARARALALRGAHQDAAEAYRSFVQHFPEDARHATAALELGRLRMDVLHDPAGAIAPLRRAAAVRGPVQADAQSRYVRALHAAKQWSECKRQRQVYDHRFPHGVHRPSLAQLCSPGEPSP